MARLIAILMFVGCARGLTAAEAVERDADLLVVGGTESGCAAAVQAARMGVKKIILVNDIQWLGGQFSAEGLGAIDENRAEGYDGTVPIPRSGLFREIIDAIESQNAEFYGGVKRPGNTRVITTVRPVVAEQVFRELLQPYEATGQIQRFSNLAVRSAELVGNRLVTVDFESVDGAESTLTVNAKLTIDASDWGDVIQAADAEYDFGIDARAEFGEPSAPPSHQPENDMNPITWCAILRQQADDVEMEMPDGYDERNFQGSWNWIDAEFAYTTRRLVDGKGFDQIEAGDVILMNNPNIDYPLDRYPANVASALEANQRGTSTKNIVQLTREQRAIVYADAKRRTLHYLYYLRSKFPRFRKLSLSDEFGTVDRLPPKPYLRESLRLVSRHIVTEQEVLGFGARSHYARAMYPDGVFSWQFELDFHPTARKFLDDDDSAGPWEADFRGVRRFGNGGTGRAMFPLRSLVPVRVTGLLGAQKNLGYTSIVSSSCRLHDHSVAVGQASGAVAAVSLVRDVEPAKICFDQAALFAVWDGLLGKHGVGVAIWPFADVDPLAPGFEAIEQLALRRLLPIQPDATAFLPDQKPDEIWLSDLADRLQDASLACDLPTTAATRRDVAIAVWQQVSAQPFPARQWLTPGDADDDGISDSRDPLPFTAGTCSWKTRPDWDGVPDQIDDSDVHSDAFNFTSPDGPAVVRFSNDHGAVFTEQTGFGWLSDCSNNTRLRKLAPGTVRDGFVFTREQATWERRLKNGSYAVTICVGDVRHDQPHQFVAVEGNAWANDVSTEKGSFREFSGVAEVKDGRLTVTIGRPEGGSNTTLNWVTISPSLP